MDKMEIKLNNQEKTNRINEYTYHIRTYKNKATLTECDERFMVDYMKKVNRLSGLVVYPSVF